MKILLDANPGVIHPITNYKLQIILRKRQAKKFLSTKFITKKACVCKPFLNIYILNQLVVLSKVLLLIFTLNYNKSTYNSKAYIIAS